MIKLTTFSYNQAFESKIVQTSYNVLDNSFSVKVTDSEKDALLLKCV